MLKRLLVPLDGTPQAASALPLARTIAHVTDASLLVLRVAAESDRSDDAERYLQAVAQELEDRTVTCIVRHGNPAKEIVASARYLEADLIVMATHGRVGLERAVRGSVAEHVLTHSPMPVVLVRPGGKRVSDLKTLLVPTDGTAGAALALDMAIGLARAGDGRLVLVQAIEPIPLWVNAADYGVAPGSLDPAWVDEAVSAAQVYIAALVSRLRTDGVKANGQVVRGGAVESIEAVADQTDADLIVMSTHALTGPVRSLLGSTADAVVRTANRPVLLVRRRGGGLDCEAMAPGGCRCSLHNAGLPERSAGAEGEPHQDWEPRSGLATPSSRSRGSDRLSTGG
jgi:nucleotide-binding universal stress UspA family protein